LQVLLLLLLPWHQLVEVEGLQKNDSSSFVALAIFEDCGSY
jgi:hypothetical protein